MIKNLILLVILIQSFKSYSQKFDDNKFIKDYGITTIKHLNRIDSVTIIITADITENLLIKLVMYVAKYNVNNGQFLFDKLELSHQEIYNNYDASYVKKQDDIFRIRSENNGKESFYYFDKLENLKFKNVSTIFQGEKSNGFNFYQLDDCYVLTSSIKSQLYYTNFEIHLLNFNDFTVISSKKYSFTKKNKIFTINETKLKNNIVFDYLFFDENDKKIKIKIISNTSDQLNEITINSSEFYPLTYLTLNNKTLIYSLNRDSYIGKLYEFNSDNSGIKELDSKLIPLELMTKENEDSKELSYSQKSSFWIDNILYENNNTVYILSYSTHYHSEVGRTYDDVIITKISENKIIWNQYINRGSRLSKGQYYSDIQFIGDELILNDIERSKLLNSMGDFQKNEKKGGNEYLVDFIKIQVYINKSTGKFQRKLL